VLDGSHHQVTHIVPLIPSVVAGKLMASLITAVQREDDTYALSVRVTSHGALGHFLPTID
jgi:hypothetical protein